MTFAYSRLALAAAIAVAGLSPLAAQQTTGAKPGAVEQTGAAAVPQDKKPAPLQLTDEQREHIRKVLGTTHTKIEPPKSAPATQKEFKPVVGEQLPKGFNVDGLPQQLAVEIPILKQYGYVKFGDQILIVDPTTNKIVDQFNEG
jgi:hypothetical protein